MKFVSIASYTNIWKYRPQKEIVGLQIVLLILVVSWKRLKFISLDYTYSDSYTLVYQIDVQYEINVQVGKFLKKIKRAGQNRHAGGKFFSQNQ